MLLYCIQWRLTMGSWIVTDCCKVGDSLLFKKYKSVLGLVPIQEAILICLWVLYNPCLEACGGFIRKRTDSYAFCVLNLKKKKGQPESRRISQEISACLLLCCGLFPPTKRPPIPLAFWNQSEMETGL